MELERAPRFTIEEMKPEDIEAATAMRLASWLDTYVNDEAGVTREWVEARNCAQQLPEKQESRRQRFIDGKANGTFNGWVAKGANGDIIGSTTPFIDDDGARHLGSLYVDRQWHGAGVGHQLMQRAMDWLEADSHDIVLGVVIYNERAKAFYRKWGLEEVHGSETLFDDMIPEIMMIRKAKETV